MEKFGGTKNNVLLYSMKGNQVEPRCAERWQVCPDEQFDLAACFLSHNINDHLTS